MSWKEWEGHEPWAEWHDTKQAGVWDASLDAIEDAAGKLNVELGLGGRITRCRWDLPEVNLHWKAGAVDRNVSLLLLPGYNPIRLAVSISVWQDLADRPRNGRTLSLDVLEFAEVNVLREKIRENVAAAIERHKQFTLSLTASAFAD